ncbi:hypothetical protein ACROYT_G027602 [Oculina patagonica]
MAPKKMLVFVEVFMVSLMFRDTATQQCGSDTYSMFQMMLKGHTFRTFQARPMSLDCREACTSDVRCQSYNYVFFKDICELNNRTKEARPEDFVKNSDRYYMKKAPNRVPLGSIPELPADSCTEIMASEGAQTVSGNYWLDSTRSGNSILARCDMNIEKCQEAFGMESGSITDGQITASSQWSDDHAAVQGRLHFQATSVKKGAWIADTRIEAGPDAWLQVDLGSKYFFVTGVATQGRNGYSKVQCVTKYNLQYSDDEVNFQYYKEQGQITNKEFAGNTDRDTVVYHDLNPPIRARYIRFRPVACNRLISMRAELYGCQA